MAEKGIIFCTDLIPKILHGTKTVTRRCHTTLRYAVGDVLRLQECWACVWADRIHLPCEPVRADCEWGEKRIVYKADGHILSIGKWTPGRFMFKWAARPNRYRVTAAGFVWLQDITEKDAMREGVTITEAHRIVCACFNQRRPDLARIGPAQQAFSELWECLNGTRKGWSWDDNPRVARYAFEEIK